MAKYEDIELELNYLAYSRYVSRSHTIFATCFDIMLSMLLGITGFILSLVEIGYIKNFNKFYFLSTLILVIFLSLLVGIIAFYFLYDSRLKRIEIVKQIKEIQKKI